MGNFLGQIHCSGMVKKDCEKVPQGVLTMKSPRHLCCILVKSHNRRELSPLPWNPHRDEGKLGPLLDADVMSLGPGCIETS